MNRKESAMSVWRVCAASEQNRSRSRRESRFPFSALFSFFLFLFPISLHAISLLLPLFTLLSQYALSHKRTAPDVDISACILSWSSSVFWLSALPCIPLLSRYLKIYNILLFSVSFSLSFPHYFTIYNFSNSPLRPSAAPFLANGGLFPNLLIRAEEKAMNKWCQKTNKLHVEKIWIWSRIGSHPLFTKFDLQLFHNKLLAKAGRNRK